MILLFCLFVFLFIQKYEAVSMDLILFYGILVAS